MTSRPKDVSTEMTLPTRVTIEAHPILDSTNTLAKTRAAQGAPAWTVIQASEQSAGRGRQAKDWASPVGNLYTSTILRPSRPMSEWSQLSFVTALSVVEVANKIAPAARTLVKWPNDVLSNDRKISGILLETVPSKGKDGAVVVGVGINIASAPDATRYGATCLDEVAGSVLSIDDVRALYLNAFTRWYDTWIARGFDTIRAVWLESAHGLRQKVLVKNRDASDLHGWYVGIAGDGRMMIETGDGATVLISAGTVVFLGSEEA
jgi:BirA family transcriptional regulator, biotin operon repressor / biotin---[acetyl-CoA-carboxylase] ligase